MSDRRLRTIERAVEANPDDTGALAALYSHLLRTIDRYTEWSDFQQAVVFNDYQQNLATGTNYEAVKKNWDIRYHQIVCDDFNENGVTTRNIRAILLAGLDGEDEYNDLDRVFTELGAEAAHDNVEMAGHPFHYTWALDAIWNVADRGNKRILYPVAQHIIELLDSSNTEILSELMDSYDAIMNALFEGVEPKKLTKFFEDIYKNYLPTKSRPQSGDSARRSFVISAIPISRPSKHSRSFVPNKPGIDLLIKILLTEVSLEKVAHAVSSHDSYYDEVAETAVEALSYVMEREDTDDIWKVIQALLEYLNELKDQGRGGDKRAEKVIKDGLEYLVEMEELDTAWEALEEEIEHNFPKLAEEIRNADFWKPIRDDDYYE